MFSEKQTVKVRKQGLEALKRLYATIDGKAFFQSLRLEFVDPSCFSDSDRVMVKRVAEKELIEELVRRATGKEILELEMENDINE